MTMLSAAAPAMGVGVDWLSASCNSARGMQALMDWRDERFTALVGEGNQLKHLHAHGRRGWAVGGASLLLGRNDVLVVLSGDRAREDWRLVAGAATNISRLDLQATTGPGAGGRHLAERSYRTLAGFPPRRGKRPAASLLTTSKGAETLYLGQRISDQFGRLYDKGAESGDAHYSGCWRYEVVLKRRYATHAVQALLATKAEGPLVAGSVHDWFRSRGVTPRFDATGLAVGSPVPPALSDDQRWRDWYRRAVRVGALRHLSGLTWREAVSLLCPLPPSREDLEAWLSAMDEESSTVTPR